MLLLCLQYLRRHLEQQGWEENSKGDPFAKFSFVDQQITATPDALKGPGWDAAIVGHQSVSYDMTIGTMLRYDVSKLEVAEYVMPSCYIVSGNNVKTGHDIPAFLTNEMKQKRTPTGSETFILLYITILTVVKLFLHRSP